MSGYWQPRRYREMVERLTFNEAFRDYVGVRCFRYGLVLSGVLPVVFLITSFATNVLHDNPDSLKKSHLLASVGRVTSLSSGVLLMLGLVGGVLTQECSAQSNVHTPAPAAFIFIAICTGFFCALAQSEFVTLPTVESARGYMTGRDIVFQPMSFVSVCRVIVALW